MAADALRDAHAENILTEFRRDRLDAQDGEPGTEHCDQSVKDMQEAADDLIRAIGEGNPVADPTRFGEEATLEFTDTPAYTMEEFADTYKRVSMYINSSYVHNTDPEYGSTLNTKEQAIEQLMLNLRNGFEEIRSKQEEIDKGEYDDGTLNRMYEHTTARARALQHMMGTRKKQEAPTEEAQPVAA
jgi:hypothetical protein